MEITNSSGLPRKSDSSNPNLAQVPSTLDKAVYELPSLTLNMHVQCTKQLSSVLKSTKQLFSFVVNSAHQFAFDVISYHQSSSFVNPAKQLGSTSSTARLIS